MKRAIKNLLATLVVSLSLVAPVLAGPYEDGQAAYSRGDYATALRLWLPLAEQGDANAQLQLGAMYKDGKGVLQDRAEAVKWYRKAAEQGNADAQWQLGAKYFVGWGVPQDYVMALMWFNLAAAKGNKQAIKARDNLDAHLWSGQIAEAQRLAREWKPKK